MTLEINSIFASTIADNRRVSATWVLHMATWVHDATRVA
jgi:hypothetical protein